MKRVNIKAKTLLWVFVVLLSGIVAVPKTAFSRDDDDRRSERREHRRDRDHDRGSRDLQGSWYKDGDRNSRAEINGDQARNERGERSRLEIDRDGNVRAPDWGDLHGHLSGNTIHWDNGSTWTRR